MAKSTPAVSYAPTVIAAAYRIQAALDPNDPDLQPAAPVVESLTERECEVLQLLANDHTPDGIAATLHISYHTVRSHIENIRSKLGVRFTAGAVAIALRSKQIQ